ncbi:MAG TPA: class I SAM-dependent methyltransferase [Nitrosopumilaceae archaeon]|nr:class I SAM-dependent methyltransferase [Nitrosopumilaceae archaeon]
MTVDHGKLMDFLGKIVNDMGAVASAPMVVIGDKLGLYREMAKSGPLLPSELAAKTGTAERYVREWLNNQSAGGYTTFDEKTGKYHLTEEQAFCLADENSPGSVLGAFQIAMSMVKDEPKIRSAFKSGGGVEWGAHDADLFEGTERFFRSGYLANLTSTWIPSLEGMEEKLKNGAKVADVGCGHGASTIIMAKAYPKSRFIGFDYHEPSIIEARNRAKKEGVSDRVKFEVAKATDFPGKDYDLVAIFDALHDMADPVGTVTHISKILKHDGILMLVEPFAKDEVKDNMNPIGRLFYGASTMVCVPCSLASNGPALGAQAGPKRLEEVVKAGGFKKFRISTSTPFNIVIEAKL